ncbi:hypothetical protein [Actinoplanes sp. DH11]|uniref:hypothetical protein n=1 Tax=Actinoplanes sp. DH11 TaxID=2857011 RepID=UPI001E6589FB|nr:hypothetical protein [Actinoplanes sp. DH11]
MTMMRPRRLATAVVVASLALGGLSGCRSEPGVAVYIGSAGHVTEAQVQRVWDETQDVLEAASAGAPVRMPIARADVVGLLLTNELYDRVVEQRRVTLPAALPYDQVAEQIGLPVSAELTRIYTANLVSRQYLLENAAAAAGPPADEDLRDVHRRFADNDVTDQDYATFRSGLQPGDLQELGATFALRDELAALVGSLDVKVSPRYENLELGLASYTDRNTGRSFPIVTVPFGEPGAEPLVVDVA